MDKTVLKKFETAQNSVSGSKTAEEILYYACQITGTLCSVEIDENGKCVITFTNK
jgi:hypothetical protein